MSNTVPVISGRQFASTFALRGKQFAWFLGAGASAASGIPTAYMMIRDFKKRIFCRETNVASAEIDASDKVWSERIDAFLRQRNLLDMSAGNEYAAAFEALYPSERDRRTYLEEQIRRGVSTYAHRVLAALVSAKVTPAVFTTNFDQLVENSITVADDLLPPQDRAMPVVAALDSKFRASQALDENRWPLVVKLHGDYQSTTLKNTSEELASQDQDFRRVLTSACERFGLVVVGYSGRDESIMHALHEVLRNPKAFPGGLYWVASRPTEVLPSVRELLEHAQLAGCDASFIASDTFDDLAGDLQRQFELPAVLRAHVDGFRLRSRLEPAPLPQVAVLDLPVLRCSALPVLSMPQRARRIRLQRSLTTREAREVLREKNVRAVVASVGTDLAAFGADDKLLDAFSADGAEIAGTIDLLPTEDSWALGLLYESLAKALSRGRPLKERHRKGVHSLVVSQERVDSDADWRRKRREMLSGLTRAFSPATLTGRVQSSGLPFSEGVELKLEFSVDSWWCGFNPFTHVDLPKPAEDGTRDGSSVTLSADWRRERWARRYNGAWSDIISAWAGLLAPVRTTDVSAFGLVDGAGIDAVFTLSSVTAYARPAHDHEYFRRTR